MANKNLQEQIQEQKKLLDNEFELEARNIEKLNELELSNVERLVEAKLQKERRMNERLLKEGLTSDQILLAKRFEANKEALDEEFNQREEAIKAEQKLIESLKDDAEKDRKKKELADKKKQLEDDKKAVEKAAKIKEKQNKKEAADLFKNIRNSFDGLGDLIFNKEKLEELKKELKAEGKSDAEIEAALRKARHTAGIKAFSDFAKELKSTINDIANAKTEIDTRLQGSKGSTMLGSYWDRMSSNITKYIGVSPFLKQEDATANLKKLVGQGIAFNVEQRAFLETIKGKIADTFETTDSTLLRLVRIQQSDTTAARLGMESALTAFLNNMYETTEYMQQAADSIRQNLYEASALMGAAEATAFEYQVQKWMGSLHSVGFSNTEGLAGAFGKLAAGDISGVTDGGYGNLLVMAATRANLSIAEILANGLDDSETNRLMQAMVEYLGQIYYETKNSKVVAQQFANVYGLTASDLKAAANLVNDTNLIGKNSLSYGGMLGRLTEMADSMWARTSMGQMSENLIGNFKYATAGSMARNPAAYFAYTIADMLDSAVGGIPIPTIGAWAMGNGSQVNLEGTIADYMRVASLAMGLLGGVGTMLVGLGSGSIGGFSGSGMLKAFGVDTSGTTVVTRGNGDLGATGGGYTATSLSGLVGNADGSSIVDKTLQDAKESANEQLVQALEEQSEVKLNTVDDHVVQIYDLLQAFSSGAAKIHVTNDSTTSNPWLPGEGPII